jgi:hypothetical protein
MALALHDGVVKAERGVLYFQVPFLGVMTGGLVESLTTLGGCAVYGPARQQPPRGSELLPQGGAGAEPGPGVSPASSAAQAQMWGEAGRGRRGAAHSGRGKMAAAAAATAAAEQVCESRRGRGLEEQGRPGPAGGTAVGAWVRARGPAAAQLTGRGGAGRRELSAAGMLAKAGRHPRQELPGPGERDSQPRPSAWPHHPSAGLDSGHSLS